MLQNEKHLNELQSPMQTIKGRVEIYKGSTLETTCTCDDVLKSFTVGREGEDKFFGFGVCQKLNMDLLGQDVPLTITKEHYIKVAYGVKYQEQGQTKIDYLYPYPTFYLHEVQKDAETDEVTLIGYDKLYKAAEYTVADLGLTGGYTLRTFATACASLLGVGIAIGVTDNSFNTSYPGGANFEGTENLREALNAIAEATQTIYYINNNNELVFKRLDKAGESVWTIDRNSYISLKNSDSLVLSRVVHATELGDNVAPETTTEGVTQYVRNNPFWDLREDIATLVTNAQANAGGLTISPFECDWFGNHLLEIGDKIKLITRKGAAVISYLLNDSITYSGTLEETTSWTYEEDEAETADNPVSLGEALNQTFARVDKVNKEITLQAKEISDNSEAIAALKITTAGISTSVTNVKTIAETAQSTANSASGTANSALSTANSANGTANSALGVANGANTTANSALGAANTANGTANSALEVANSANNAVTSLATRVTTAETAITQKADSVTVEAIQDSVTTIDGKVVANESAITALQVNTESISASVKTVEEKFDGKVGDLEDAVSSVEKELSLKMTTDEFSIKFDETIKEGVDEIKTSTSGYTFNNEGLTISKSGSEMTTQITEDGMSIKRDNDEVLKADNTGVKAQDLHATTYLIVGGRSRFQNYESNRTGCFWIGGMN